MKKSFPIENRPLWPAFLTFVFFLLSTSLLKAQQVSGAGSTSTNFQKIGMGARAAAMGDSFTAVSDDSSAVFWNPAGLILAKGTQFSLTHGEWLVGVTHEFFSFSQNIDRDGAFGGSFGYLGTGSFQGALEDPLGNYAGPGGAISASNFSGTLAYAQRLGNWFKGDFFNRTFVGLSATVVGQNLVNVGNAGAAFNLGVMEELTRKTFYLGGVILNAGTPIQNFSQPLLFKFGGSYQLHNLFMKKDRDIISADLDGHIDTGFKPCIGDEYRMTFGRNDVALRAGYSTEDDLSGITAGIGIAHRFDDFQASLDYAYVPYGVLGDTHRIAVNVVIGGVMIKPEAYAVAYPFFILGQQTVGVNFSTKNEEPIDGYKITITDSTGAVLKTLEGKGGPPSHYLWDGRNQAGELVPQGDYNFTLSVTDDNDLNGTSKPAQTYAKWVPKKVPYQYSFQVPGDLLFDSAKAELLKRGYEAIQKAALAIRQRYPDSMIVIAGHTDDQKLAKGAHFKDNLELSQARAKACMDYLVKNGLDGSKLSVVGYGDTKPIASNATKEGRAKNRRVELVVSGVMDASSNQLIEEGKTMFNQGNYREALDRFLKAIEADSRNPKAYHWAGDCYMRLGGKPQAIAAYQKALKYNPSDAALKQWMDANGPKEAPAPAPSSATPGPDGSAQPGADNNASSAPQPTGQDNSSQGAPSGVSQPVGGQ